MPRVTSKKPAVDKPWINPKPVTVEQVLAVLTEDDRFFAKAKEYWARFNLIRFQDSWQVRDTKVIVCDSLTYVEDWLEYDHPRMTAARDKFKALRRRLEWILWP